MPCEQYKDALIEAALSGGALPAAPQSHVESCCACRQVLIEERALSAAIESGVREVTNAQLPSAFLAHVRARLAEAPVQQCPGVLAWGVGFTVAASLLVIGVGLSLRGHKENAHVVSVDSPALSVKQEKRAIPPVPTPVLRPPPSDRKRLTKSSTGHVQRADPEVLVPPDEREAFARFVADLNADRSVAVALVSPLAERPDQHDGSFEIPRLEIAELALPLLDPRSED
jgi:hypothetical protein